MGLIWPRHFRVGELDPGILIHAPAGAAKVVIWGQLSPRLKWATTRRRALEPVGQPGLCSSAARLPSTGPPPPEGTTAVKAG